MSDMELKISAINEDQSLSEMKHTCLKEIVHALYTHVYQLVAGDEGRT